MSKPLPTVIDSNGKVVPVKPWSAVSAVNTGAAAVTIKAATTSKRMWIRRLVVCNKTPGEYPIVTIQDEDDTAIFGPIGLNARVATSPATEVYEFDRDSMPVVAAGKALESKLASETGDVYVSAQGFVEA